MSIARAAGEPNATVSPSRKRRYLVVDDDPQMRALVAYALRRDGAEIVEAGGGIDLLKWAELTTLASHGFFDAIIADICMPDLNAIEVLSKVPSITRKTPVILMTAFRDERAKQRAYDLGVEMVISKPFDPISIRAFARAVSRHSNGA